MAIYPVDRIIQPLNNQHLAANGNMKNSLYAGVKKQEFAKAVISRVVCFQVTINRASTVLPYAHLLSKLDIVTIINFSVIFPLTLFVI